MQIKTNLDKQDYIKAYKELCSFIVKRPLFGALLMMLGYLTTAVPFTAFVAKMAVFGLVTSALVCITTTWYRTGSLKGVLQELLFQQRLFLPAIVAIVGLSWLGLMVAQFALTHLSGALVSGVNASAQVSGEPIEGTGMLAAVVAATLVCIGQIMPYVLAHFCRGLDLSKSQGEHIWLSLMMKMKTFIAFLPLAQLIPIGIVFGVDTTGILLVTAVMYSTFLLFVVFNIEPSEPEKAANLTLVEQL